MLDLFLNVLCILTAVITIGSAIRLKSNALGSTLYSSVTVLSLCGALIPLLYLGSQYFKDTAHISVPLIAVFLSVYAFLAYNVCRITFNQTSYKNYTVEFLLLSLTNIIVTVLVIMKIVDNDILEFIVNYQPITIIQLLVIAKIFYKYGREFKTVQVRFISLVLLVDVLAMISFSLAVVSETSLLYLVFTLMNLFIVIIYTQDYKNSFYY